MHNSEIRLECLKLAHRPGLSPQEVIATAREYLSWVGGVPSPITPAKGPDDRSKAVKLAPTANAQDKPSENSSTRKT